MLLLEQELFSWQKTKAITYLLTYATVFLARHFRVTQRKSLEIQACSVTKGRTLSS